MSGIVTSTFKAVLNPGGCGGHSGCEGWDPSGFGGGRGGLSSDFPTIFVLFLSDLSSEALSSTLSISSLKYFHKLPDVVK